MWKSSMSFLSTVFSFSSIELAFIPETFFQLITHTGETAETLRCSFFWNFSFEHRFVLPCSHFPFAFPLPRLQHLGKITFKWSTCGLECSLSSNFDRHAFPKAPNSTFSWEFMTLKRIKPFLWGIRRKEPLFPANSERFSFHSKCWNEAEYVSSK